MVATMTRPQEVDGSADVGRTLYHFCCTHSASAILDDNLLLRPSDVSWKEYDLLIVNRLRGAQFASGLDDATTPRVVWLTSDPDPTRKAVGLHQVATQCDRMAWRFTVDADSVRNVHKIMPWRTFTSLYLPNPEWRMNLEFGRDVPSWYVAVAPVLAMMGGPYASADEG